jgi:hypothetical protein
MHVGLIRFFLEEPIPNYAYAQGHRVIWEEARILEVESFCEHLRIHGWIDSRKWFLKMYIMRKRAQFI